MASPKFRYRLLFMRAAFVSLFALWGTLAMAQAGFSGRNNALGTAYNNSQNQMQYGAVGGTVDNNATDQKKDTTKKRKPRKPLESYFLTIQPVCDLSLSGTRASNSMR